MWSEWRPGKKNKNTSDEPHQREILQPGWWERWNIDASRSLWLSLGRSGRKWAIRAPAVLTASLSVCLCIFESEPNTVSSVRGHAYMRVCGGRVRVGYNVRKWKWFAPEGWVTIQTYLGTKAATSILTNHPAPSAPPHPRLGPSPVCLSVVCGVCGGAQQLSWASYKTTSNHNCNSERCDWCGGGSEPPIDCLFTAEHEQKHWLNQEILQCCAHINE